MVYTLEGRGFVPVLGPTKHPVLPVTTLQPEIVCITLLYTYGGCLSKVQDNQNITKKRQIFKIHKMKKKK